MRECFVLLKKLRVRQIFIGSVVLVVFVATITIAFASSNKTERDTIVESSKTVATTAKVMTSITTEKATEKDSQEAKEVASKYEKIPNKTETVSTTNDSPAYIDKLEIVNKPFKTVYYVGDEYVMDGILIKGYFTNGAVEDLTSKTYYYPEKAINPGKAHINIEYCDYYDNLGWTNKLVFTVKEPTVNISDRALTLNLGDIASLSTTTDPAGQTVSWHVSDPNVLNIDSNGNINAIALGSSVVYATFTYNEIEYTSEYCTVTVKGTVPETETITQSEKTMDSEIIN